MLLTLWNTEFFLPTVFLAYWFVFNKNIRLQNVFFTDRWLFLLWNVDWRFSDTALSQFGQLIILSAFD
jgi:hypothetical protein